jgi:histidyl-tRNA synthetase
MGIERLTMLLQMQDTQAADGPACYIVWVGEKSRDWAFPLVHRLRQKGISLEMEGEIRSLKSQMRRADKLKAASVLIVGDDELAKGKVVLRNMASKQQEEISLDGVEAELIARKAS